MNNYSLAFVGMGSIGKRHFRNVCKVLEEQGYNYSIDLFRSDVTRQLPEDIMDKVNMQYIYSGEISEETMYDAVFITNPTSLHLETIKKFKEHTKAFFIEKPIFDTIDIDDSFLKELDDTISYVACPLRYCPALKYLKEQINYEDAISIRAISSSYLPDWRPGQDYRQCYSAHRDMGGGVGIDLIHEWDYLTAFWGMPKEVFVIQDQISQLEIDSDDIAIYIARVGNKTIELHLDYFGRKTVRTLELYMPNDTIRIDIEDGVINYLKDDKIIHLGTERNDYQVEEIQHFFSIVQRKIANDSTPRHAYNVLKLTKGLI